MRDLEKVFPSPVEIEILKNRRSAITMSNKIVEYKDLIAFHPGQYVEVD